MPLRCRPYNHDELARVIAESVGKNLTESEVRSRPHYHYLCEYLDYSDARTIIVEDDYVDRDYLEDYAAFYARCYAEFPRRCVRLHFTKERLATRGLHNLLAGSAGGQRVRRFPDLYLGFSVIRPLRRRFVGRTCLRTFAAPGRLFPVRATYAIGLCGLSLTVESLAFQQQDGVTAACASAALWSAFHATSRVFGHHLPSPSTITRSATASDSCHRVFPAGDGLTLEEMASACRQVGLEPDQFWVSLEARAELNRAVVGYLQAGVPVVLLAHLVDVSQLPSDTASRGGHAVTVVGYKLGDATCPHVAGNVMRLYAHDDGVGPFASMDWIGTPRGVPEFLEGRGSPCPAECLTTHWLPGDVVAVPLAMLVPLHHKVRVNHVAAWARVRQMESDMPARLRGQVVWDLVLNTVNAAKQEWQSSNRIDRDQKLELLQQGLPRYLWRARAWFGDTLGFEVVLDATDLPERVEHRAIVNYT